MRKTFFAGLATGLLLFGIVGLAQANLITNGDFESGDFGFSTDYSDIGIGVSGGTYSITTDPNLNHYGATSYGDHTTGSGYMMAVNGSNIPDKIVWGQDVMLQSDTNYLFSIFISSWTSSSVAELDFSLSSGAMTLGMVTAPAITGIWEEYQVSFNSGAMSGLTSISFVDSNLVLSGNDFAVDDISLLAAPVPEPSTILLLSVGLVGLAGNRIRRKKNAQAEE